MRSSGECLVFECVIAVVGTWCSNFGDKMQSPPLQHHILRFGLGHQGKDRHWLWPCPDSTLKGPGGKHLLLGPLLTPTTGGEVEWFTGQITENELATIFIVDKANIKTKMPEILCYHLRKCEYYMCYFPSLSYLFCLTNSLKPKDTLFILKKEMQEILTFPKLEPKMFGSFAWKVTEMTN